MANKFQQLFLTQRLEPEQLKEIVQAIELLGKRIVDSLEKAAKDTGPANKNLSHFPSSRHADTPAVKKNTDLSSEIIEVLNRNADLICDRLDILTALIRSLPSKSTQAGGSANVVQQNLSMNQKNSPHLRDDGMVSGASEEKQGMQRLLDAWAQYKSADRQENYTVFQPFGAITRNGALLRISLRDGFLVLPHGGANFVALESHFESNGDSDTSPNVRTVATLLRVAREDRDGNIVKGLIS